MVIANYRILKNINIVILKFYFVFVAISLIGEPIRLMGIFNTAVISRFLVVLMLYIYILIIFQYNKKFKYDNTIIPLFIFMFVYGVVLGLLSFNSLKEIISESIVVIVAGLSFLFFFTYKINQKDIYKLINTFSYIFLLVELITISIGFMLKIVFHIPIYLSLSHQILLMPLIWFKLTKKFFLMYITFLLIIIGGKIGVLFSSFAIFLSFYLVKKQKNLFNIFVISLISIMVFILFLFIIKDLSVSDGSFYYDIFWKFQTYNPFYIFSKNDIDIDSLALFGGGRIAEVIYSIQDLVKNDVLNFFSGKGFGIVYYNPLINMYIHNVHITPIGLVTKFGVVILLLIYFVLFYNLNLIYKKVILKEKNIINNFFFYLLIGQSVYSLTAFSFYINLLLWISLGYLKNKLVFERIKNIMSPEKTTKIKKVFIPKIVKYEDYKKGYKQ